MRKLFERAQDRISCETHAFGAAAALGGGLLYLLRGIWTGAAPSAVGAAMCFCLSMIALYAASAIYHYYPGTAASGGVKRRLRKMDHSMIYVLIAGSYTPFCVLLPQPAGRRFCLALWGVALTGVLVKMLWINAPRILSGGRVMAETELSDSEKVELIVDTLELCSCKRRIRAIRARLRTGSAPDEETERLFGEATELQRRVNSLTLKLSSASAE